MALWWELYQNDHVWINHALQPVHIKSSDFRIPVGQGPHAYQMSILNISGTSYGALSGPALESFNRGARLGGFAHNSGEGGIAPAHTRHGGDLVWQIGTGYFGCRSEEGHFDATKFATEAARDQVKMIEIKLSQGAKPGHGGMLLGAKVTADIARIRDVPQGEDCISPAAHSAFHTPEGLLDFVAELRQLIWRQASWLQAVYWPSLGISGDSQGDGGNWPAAGFYHCGRG